MERRYWCQTSEETEYLENFESHPISSDLHCCQVLVDHSSLHSLLISLVFILLSGNCSLAIFFLQKSQLSDRFAFFRSRLERQLH